MCLRHLCVSVPPALCPVLPLLLKNSREYFPESAKCLGIQPSSSMMWAMWSTEEKRREVGGWEEREEKGGGKGMPKKREKRTERKEIHTEKGWRQGREGLIERGEIKVKCKEIQKRGKGGDRLRKEGRRKDKKRQSPTVKEKNRVSELCPHSRVDEMRCSALE